MRIPIPRSSDTPPRSRFYDELLPQIAALPGIASVAAIDNLPMEGGSEQPIAVEGRPAEVFALQRNVSVRRATPDYFRTMEIPIRAGRDFQLRDTTSPESAAIISQAMANLFWPGEDALGKKFRISFTPETLRTVVGIVGDIRERGLDALEPVAELYLPFRNDDLNGLTLVVRGSAGVSRLSPAIAGVLAKIDPGLPIRDVRTMDEVVASTIAQQRFSMWLFAALAGLACLLAIVGIYSVLAYSVRGRAHEIGVRMALGASAGDVVRLVITEGMRPALTGVLVGAFGAVALRGVLSKLIYGVSPTDPLTFLAVALLLGFVALTACAIPAWRAARVQPVTALRDE
jgi:predicted permease